MITNAMIEHVAKTIFEHIHRNTDWYDVDATVKITDWYPIACAATDVIEEFGCRVVPYEPTDSMFEIAGYIIGVDAVDYYEATERHVEWWQAMIDATEEEEDQSMERS